MAGSPLSKLVPAPCTATRKAMNHGEDEEDDDHDGVGDAEEEDDDVNYRYRGGGLGSYCSIPNARGPKYPLLHCMTKL